MLKDEIRVIGIDDSPFKKFKRGQVLVVGTIFRGGKYFDGILSTKVSIDGNNSTKKITDMINRCKFKPQLQCILLNGISVGGFNIIDIKELSRKTKLPVIVVIRKNPNIKLIKETLEKIRKKHKIRLIEKAGSVVPVGEIFIQLTGLSIEKAKEILKITCTRSLIPEPIRISHLIASGITDGESRGKA
ncbi:MAG: DUF99 family protein [Nanoarchaeota archaeon]